MVTVAINIGYETDGNNGVLSRFPMLWEFESVRSFTSFIRENSLDLVLWAIKSYVSKSSLVLYVNITREYSADDCWENEFTIHCKNIREYMPYLHLYTEEIEAMKRDQKINSIINE